MTVEWIRSGVTVLAALLGSGIIGILLHYRSQNAKTKAEAVKINAEAEAIKVDDQTDIIDNLRKEVSRLADRVAALEHRNEKLEARHNQVAERNRSLREALLIITHWVQRVWLVLTPQQKAEVGQPPNTDHLLTD